MFDDHARFPQRGTVSSVRHPVDALRDVVSTGRMEDHAGLAQIQRMMDFNGFGYTRCTKDSSGTTSPTQWGCTA